jgi:hypothetical protein
VRHVLSTLAIATLSAAALSTRGTITLAVADDLPTEFRIFKAGWNDTENGRYLFDDKAAQDVITASKRWDVDNMIDLEHLSVDKEAPNYDPDARGWFRLELRDDAKGKSELWAVSVRWTEDGAERLSKKKQRYISPAFDFDTKTKRVTQILNAAITALPATHGAIELVAASRASDLRKLSTGPSFADVSGAIQDALKARMPAAPPDYCTPWVVDLFDASVVFQVGAILYEVSYAYANGVVTLGEPSQVTRSYTPVAAAPAEPSAPAQESAALTPTKKGKAIMTLADFLKVCKALGLDPEKTSVEQLMARLKGEKPADETANAAPPAEDPPSEEEEEASTTAAAASVSVEGRLAMEATGLASPAEAMAELTRRSKIAVDFEAQQAQLSKDRSKLELEERTKIVKSLQTLGVETPATSGLASGKLCARLLNEPIAELRARHAQLLAARGVKPSVIQPVQAPAGDGAGQAIEVTLDTGEKTLVTLSAREDSECARLKIDRVAYATNLANIAARSTHRRAEQPQGEMT